MSKIAFLIAGGAILLALVWIAVDNIVYERKKKRAEKKAKEHKPEHVARKLEPEFGVDGNYVQAVAINNRAKEHMQLVCLKTKAASPDEVLCDALHLYVQIVNMYSPGDQLVLHKAPDMGGILLKFPPLERIEKKVES